MISPPFVTALALIKLFGRRGLITYGILNLNVNPYGWQGIVLLQIIGNLSVAIMMLNNSFDKIDNRLILASLDLGASPWQTFKSIVLPNVYSGILSVIFTLFTINLADFSTPIIIGGKFKVLATEAYKLIFATGNLSQGSAMSVLMLIPAVISFFFYSRFMNQINNTNNVGKQIGNISYKFNLPLIINIFVKLITFAFFSIMILKYANIFITAFANTSSGKIEFTLKFFKLLRSDLILAFIRSIIYSICAGIIASILGVLFSYYNYKKNFRLKTFDFFTSLPYVIPGTFFGLGYVIAFNNKPFMLTGTAIIIILNLAFRQMSVATKTANALFPTIDSKLETAAQDLGASKLKILITITLPIIKPALITSFIQTFTASMTSVGAIIFLISPGKNVISVEMFKAIQSGGYELGSILALMILFITIIVNYSAVYIMKRGEN